VEPDDSRPLCGSQQTNTHNCTADPSHPPTPGHTTGRQDQGSGTPETTNTHPGGTQMLVLEFRRP